MNLYQLAWKHIQGSAFRSWAVGLCALLIASFALATTLIMRGAQGSLRLAIERLGADIVVVPEGTPTETNGALLMGRPAEARIPAATLGQLAVVPGIQMLSPQVYLTTLTDLALCSAGEVTLIAYDPQTDFTIEPWLTQTLGDGLHLGEAVGGSCVSAPGGDVRIELLGYPLTLKASLDPTGTALDRALFVTLETARDLARKSTAPSGVALRVDQDALSAILVRVEPGADVSEVAVQIMHDVPGVLPVESPSLFRAYRQQMTGLQKAALTVMGGTLALCIALIALVFSLAANERRRELAVLRAMGATRAFVLQSLLFEAGVLAVSGGMAGVVLTLAVAYLFRNLLAASLSIPVLLPGALSLANQVAGGLLATLAVVTLAAAFPAYRMTHQDLAAGMRH